MDKYTSIEAVLKRAMALEDEAAGLYTTAAKAAKVAPVRKQLEEMAEQERGHKAKLQTILEGNIRWAVRQSKAEAVTDLRLSDHLEPRPLDASSDFQDILLFAARREKVAHDFYQAMAEMVDDRLTKDVFELLAAEELRHKYALEKTYEEVIYKDF